MNFVFKETGHSLSTLHNVILHEWETLVREIIEQSRHQPSIILQDHIPAILKELESILKEGRVDEAELGKQHGYYRSTMTNFSVADVMMEYSLLREVLMTYLYPMGEVECAKLIHKYLDILSKHSVVEFVNDHVAHSSLSLENPGNEVGELKNNPIISNIH